MEAANTPALVGVPDPDAEMASGEAVGEPLERVAPRELEEREDEPRSPKKHKSGTSQQMQDEAATGAAVGDGGAVVESGRFRLPGAEALDHTCRWSDLRMLHLEEPIW